MYGTHMRSSSKRSGPDDFAFEEGVTIDFGSKRLVISDAEAARTCLLEDFIDQGAPSYRRALATCEAFMDGNGTAAGAQAIFMVAVMEAGFPFEVQDIDLDLLAAQLTVDDA